MRDWLIRALKTFAQAFLGVFIPEIIAILSGNTMFRWDEWKTYLIPLGCSALAAGISAVWNMYLEYQQRKALKGEEGE